jgi:hypothetical protein
MAGCPDKLFSLLQKVGKGLGEKTHVAHKLPILSSHSRKLLSSFTEVGVGQSEAI